MNPRSGQTDPLTEQPYASAQFANVVTAVRELQHPSQIGPYKIQEIIGEGGMGTVYRAEQREPIRRTVAVKVIKLGMDTREVIARFESERQALAMMNHPNVAKVLDAGATDTGRPYFVMEYVAGEPITAFADRQKLTIRQRLELFIQACDALQHAHQKAIIHRDLKPSNILVTLVDDKPQVKVIDFGVAKAISQRLTEKTLFTETGQLVGTPEYMAPEQAEGRELLDVDTRSDVYSLGVVLYELLSGALPFESKTLRSGGYGEIQRIIREVDPPRPSTKLSRLGKGAQEVARLRQTPLEVLQRQLHRELDWIPLKAMHKDRTRRYASATELAEDIAHYLSNRPLRAAPDSAAYRLRKFLRRNKTGVAASAAMVLLLLAGITATTWQAIRATRAEREVRQALHKVELANANTQAVNTFLTDDLLASAAPEVTRGRDMTVHEALDRAAQAVAQRFHDRPLTEAAIHAVLSDTYDALGKFERALAHAQAALEIHQQQHGPDQEQTLIAMHHAGRSLAKLNRHVEAEPILQQAVERSRRLLGEEHRVTITCLGGLAMTLRLQERFAEAEPLYRRVLEADRRMYGSRSDQVARSLNNLAVLLNTQRRADEAEPLYRESLMIRKELLGEDHPSYLGTMGNLARVLQDQGRLDEAEAMLRQALRNERRVLKDDHPATTLTMNNLAVLLSEKQQYEESEALHREALALRRVALGEEHIDTLQSMHNLARALTLRGRDAEAEDLFREVIARRRKVLGEDHIYTVGSISALAQVYEKQERFAEAEPLLSEACAQILHPKLNPVSQASVLARLGWCRMKLRRHADAEQPLRDALGKLREAGQNDSEPTQRVLESLVEICEQTNRPDDAARWRAELAAVRSHAPAAMSP